MFTKILLLNFTTADLTPESWSRLRRAAHETIALRAKDPAVDEHLLSTDCLLLKLALGADQALIDRAPCLRYIGMYGTGVGGIDTTHAAAKGIAVCNVPGYSTEAVAEFAIACILAQLRELHRARQQVSQRQYSEEAFHGRELQSMLLGILGLGNIGRRVAELARIGFGARVNYWSRHRKLPSEQQGIVYSDLDTLLRKSDIVSIHLAHNRSTDRFIHSDRIQAIRKNALVVNTSPMELFDIDALETRLRVGDMTLILDHPDGLAASELERFATYESCVIYPSIGYTTLEAAAAKQHIFVENIERFLQGTPINLVV